MIPTSNVEALQAEVLELEGDIIRLRANYEEANDRCEHLERAYQRSDQTRKKLTDEAYDRLQEIDKLKKALQFYAYERNYTYDSGNYILGEHQGKVGLTARQVLEKDNG